MDRQAERLTGYLWVWMLLGFGPGGLWGAATPMVVQEPPGPRPGSELRRVGVEALWDLPSALSSLNVPAPPNSLGFWHHPSPGSTLGGSSFHLPQLLPMLPPPHRCPPVRPPKHARITPFICETHPAHMSCLRPSLTWVVVASLITPPLKCDPVPVCSPDTEAPENRANLCVPLGKSPVWVLRWWMSK